MPELTAWFNALEGVFWITLAIVVHRRTNRAALPVWLALFGISDFIEIRTGAWWHPWWLLALKGACLLGIAWGLLPLLIARARSERPTDHGRSA